MSVFVKSFLLLNLLSLAMNCWGADSAEEKDPAQYSTFKNVIFKFFYPTGTPTLIVDPQESSSADSSGVIVTELQLKVCRRFEIRRCPLLPRMRSGTAFMVSNSFTVATALHNIQEWLYWVKKYNPSIDIRKISLPTYILNSEGKTILNTADNDHSLTISMMNSAPALFDLPYYEFSSKTDRMALALSEYVELTSTVALSERGIGIGPMVRDGKHAVIGFPHDKMESATGAMEQAVPQFEMLTITNIPAEPGYIGSPLYDTKGNVVAMMIASNCTKASLNCQSLFLHLNISRLRSIWDVLAGAKPQTCKKCSRFSDGVLKTALTTKERLPTEP